MKAVAIVAEQGIGQRLRDYVQLTRPRIGIMSLLTVAVGFYLGSAGVAVRAGLLFHTLLGAGLVASSASALNQWLERRADARMRRTANRPLPSGRMLPTEALVFGLVLGCTGLLYLAILLPTPMAAIAAAVTLVSYVGLYTPLKTRTAWNTVVGAFPGALPPIIGWCASHDSLNLQALSLFMILFVWQLPHFFSIAWLYREDYAAGGFRMLSANDTDGQRTGRAMVGTCLLLIPVGMLPAFLRMSGPVFLSGSIFLSVCFLNCAMQFRKEPTRQNAKYVLRASLLYLAGMLLLLVLDGASQRPSS